MRARNSLLLTAIFLGTASISQARPLLTEEPNTAGRLTFETSIGGSVRLDTFGSAPQTKYQTVRSPWLARLGLTSRFDFGFRLDYFSQRLEQNDIRYQGSSNELFSPFIKYNPWEHVGFMLFWHTKRGPQEDQELPIARGNDIEALALFSAPTPWPLTLNVGYVKRDPYNNKFGIQAGDAVRVRPGDIFELKTSMETPLPAHLSVLSELAYYHVQRETLGEHGVQNSAGDAMDALIGLSWDYKSWYLSGGASFGLLNESHTSFDLERGAGDVSYQLRLGYKLFPHKAAQS
jgi:hypothetical protein